MCILICFVFIMLVSAMTVVHARNFCLNKTTSERFTKAKVAHEARTSTYLSESHGQSSSILNPNDEGNADEAEADEGLLGSAIMEAM